MTSPLGSHSVFVHGWGAVSPAGWGMAPFRNALGGDAPPPVQNLARPGWERALRVKTVPAPAARPSFLAHARFRRTSPISQYAVAAALEALGTEGVLPNQSAGMGVILCVMSGCVNYSHRFYDETLKDPATASPLVFPETVFNAPSSHIAALLGSTRINYTLVGDPGTYLQGCVLAAEWLEQGLVDSCLVVGAEELDWLTADAFRLFSKEVIMSAGAGAIWLRREPSPIALSGVTTPRLFTRRQSAALAAARVRDELTSLPHASPTLLCDSRHGFTTLDRAESSAWSHWNDLRMSPKAPLGEGLVAGAAWQTVAAVDALAANRCRTAFVNIVGCNQQAIGAAFDRVTAHSP